MSAAPSGRKMPVLAEFAGQITALGADTEGMASREKMVQGFFLNRIRMNSGRVSVNATAQFSRFMDPDPAKSALSFVQNTGMRAKLAENAFSLFGPETGFVI